jgi:two-component system response regulator
VSPAPVLLLIEDDRDHLDVTMRALRRAGIAAELQVVRDGQAALDALGLEDSGKSERQRLPRVVFLDLKMPRIDGWEVLRRIRACPQTARLPVVVVSESDRPEDVRLCYALGANSYLLKRFDARSPGAYLAEAARYWIELNQVPNDLEAHPW